jgi:hypothetical protein
MALNKYFRNYGYSREQNVIENLIVESIKIYGIEAKYLPRTIVNQDFILGEDPLSQFNLAVDVELYVKDVRGFEGDGDFLSKFNLEIRDQVTLTMARKRWNQIVTEKLTTEVGFNYQLEEANTYSYGNSSSILLESGSANNYSLTTSRPMEGDLVFLPINNKLYEIKFVEHEAIFYQHAKLYTYDLTCELFDRDSRLRTGNTIIDKIETDFSMDMLLNRIIHEDGDYVTYEDDSYLVFEYRLADSNKAANNESFMISAPNYIDWSEQNPFAGDVRY